VFASVVQNDAVCCRVLQSVAVCCSVLQCVAVCCSAVQCVIRGVRVLICPTTFALISTSAVQCVREFVLCVRVQVVCEWPCSEEMCVLQHAKQCAATSKVLCARVCVVCESAGCV